MSRNKEHRGTASGGRPIGSVFLVSAHLFEINAAKLNKFYRRNENLTTFGTNLMNNCKSNDVKGPHDLPLNLIV